MSRKQKREFQRWQPEAATIECVACSGTGLVWSIDENDWGVLVDCDLCSGTGREPSTVQPREEPKS